VIKGIFHLAIPCLDIGETVAFYTEALGCRVARRYDDRVTFDFFSSQLVCHLSGPEEIVTNPKIYPRHFGLTLDEEKAFDGLVSRLKERRVPFFTEPFVRFAGKKEEHRSFFLKDPANNLIELKWYRDPAMRF
jgi:uncharacterized protein